MCAFYNAIDILPLIIWNVRLRLCVTTILEMKEMYEEDRFAKMCNCLHIRDSLSSDLVTLQRMLVNVQFWTAESRTKSYTSFMANSVIGSFDDLKIYYINCQLLVALIVTMINFSTFS